jgi:hypothetical protein
MTFPKNIHMYIYISIIRDIVFSGVVVVLVVWWLDLQLTMQSVSIAISVVSSNHADGEVYLIQHYVIKFVRDLWQVGGVLRFPVSIKLAAMI